jgi:hypothetical protein
MTRPLTRILVVTAIATSFLTPAAADAMWPRGTGTRRPAKPQGGNYTIVGRGGAVIYTGRSKNLSSRIRTHRRLLKNNPEYRIRIDRRTDNVAIQRGREQVLITAYRPPLNKINGIGRNNDNRATYLRTVRRFGQDVARQAGQTDKAMSPRQPYSTITPPPGGNSRGDRRYETRSAE